MENGKSEKKLKSLSASRIKVLENCSWLYWAQYHLKLPQLQNDGARKGEICHRVFETLLNPKHKTKFDQIIENKNVYVVKSIEKLIKNHCKLLDLASSSENLNQLNEMILVGLNADFFVRGGKLIAPEYKFDIQNEDPEYSIKGFIDKPFMTKDSIIIDDFKSSKKKFEGEDEESNVQAMIYSLAAQKLWPDKKPKVRFIFLQFPENPIMKLSFSEDVLKGFEHYLASIQKKVDNFSEKDARKDFAYDKSFGNGEFKGKLLCGFAKEPNTLKKDGSKMWHCPYKFPFVYYIVKKNGQFAYSTLDKEKIILKDGETIETAQYSGCPRFGTNVLNNFEPAPIVKAPKKFGNVLDGF